VLWNSPDVYSQVPQCALYTYDLNYLKAYSSIAGEKRNWYDLVGGQFGSIYQHLKCTFPLTQQFIFWLFIPTTIKVMLENV